MELLLPKYKSLFRQDYLHKFHLLPYGLAVILVFIGSKMLLIDVYKVPVWASLGFVVVALAITMIVSVKTAPKEQAKA